MLNGRKVDRGVRNPHNQGEDLTNLTFIKPERIQLASAIALSIV